MILLALDPKGGPVTTEPHTPPMEASNEAEPDQLQIARAQGTRDLNQLLLRN